MRISVDRRTNRLKILIKKVEINARPDFFSLILRLNRRDNKHSNVSQNKNRTYLAKLAVSNDAASSFGNLI